MMLDLVDKLGDQLRFSSRLEGLADIKPVAAAQRRIIFCGMGGSAIAGDLVQPLLDASGVELHVWRDYGLPPWAGSDDLVICSSYSGDTEETLSAAGEAASRSCPRLAITSGGTLARLAAQDGFPAVILPGGLPPRASLGLGLGALVRVLGRLGLLVEPADVLDHAAASLDACRSARRFSRDPEDLSDGPVPADPEGNVPVSTLARILAGRVPVIFTAGAEAHAVGSRLKAQLNENSKVPACLARFPELNHNDLVGWDLESADRGRFVLLILRGMNDNERVDRRVELTRSLLGDEFPEIHEIKSTADEPLARVLSLVQYGDYLSCHLAAERGVDPVPVDRISRLKEALGKPE